MDKLTKNTFSTFSPILKVIWIDGQNKNDISIDSKLLNQNFDNLFKRNLYSNNDIFIEESRFVLGLEHNYYNYLSGQKMYLSFGRAFFRDKKRSFLEEEIVDSSYISEFKTNLANNLSINSSLEIDKKFKKLLRGSFGMTYSKEIRKKIELRSIFKRNPKYLSEHFRTNVGSMINEIELISKWEISNNILVFGKVSKDEARNFTRDLSYGIEYSNCCLKIGLMKRKWTDQNLLFKEYELERIKNLTEGRYPERERDNVYVFFELVELGRFGKKISDVLKPKKFQ
jgi:LPS-assembly protein